ncbi:MAG TPA: hypothetical protein VF992_00585 [Thermoplasmata archaeon]
MSGVPATPPPGPPGSGPPYPPPYGPPYYPYPYYAPPPKRDNTALIIVLVVLLVVLVPVVFAAILYVMVAGLLTSPTTSPIVTFGPVDQTGGNATIPVFGASREINPSELRIRLDEDTTSSGPAAMPSPDGSVTLKIGVTWYRVFWLDQNHNGAFGVGDALLVTGNLAPLTPSTSYTVFLLDAGGSTISAVLWTSA